jgi:Tol biopolymer transport system component
MRSRSLCLGLVFAVGVIAQFQSTAQSQTPDTIRGYDIIEIGEGTTPRFSPDSKKIAFLSEGWLCVRNSDGTGPIDKITRLEALDFQWMSDSSIIYWNQEGYGTPSILRNIGIVTLSGEHKEAVTETEGVQFEPPMFLPDGTIGYYRHASDEGTKSFVVIKQGSLPADSALKQVVPRIKFRTPHVMYGDIWLVSIDGSHKRWVTFNKRFAFPELSPDGANILAHKIPGVDLYLGQGDYIIDLKGNETYIGDPDVWTEVTDSTGAELTVIEASGDAEWSPDGSKVVYVYQKTTPGAEDIAGSDLVIKGKDGANRFQMHTPGEIEINPTWSPNGNTLGAETYGTRRIFVFTLK